MTSPNPPFWTKAKAGAVGSEQNLHQYIEKLTQIFDRAFFPLKATGSLWVHSKDTRYLNGSYMMIPESLANHMVVAGWILRDKCIWYRSNTHDDDPTCWSEDWDYLYRFTKGVVESYVDKHGMWTSVFEFPFIKPPPEELVESGFPQGILDIIINCTCPPGGTVLDCFSGTGTTGVSALKNGRKFIGIDMDPRKISLMHKRLKAASES